MKTIFIGHAITSRLLKILNPCNAINLMQYDLFFSRQVRVKNFGLTENSTSLIKLCFRDVKVDSKKDSDSWQNEYEARKRARLEGKH